MLNITVLVYVALDLSKIKEQHSNAIIFGYFYVTHAVYCLKEAGYISVRENR